MKNKLVIIGCGGHARSIANVAVDAFPQIQIIFVDPYAKINELILDFPVYREYEIKEEKESVIVGIGDNYKRKLEYNKYSDLITIISKHSYIGLEVEIGKGTFIANYAHLGVSSIIGDNVIINTGACLDHEVTVARNTHIAPNATVCGRVTIGENVFVGAGAVIRDKVNICDNVIIGAGSVVLEDINIPGTYIGKITRKK